jgi:prepilin-type N-terminal cleavage/methylation domain-containing protein
MHRHQSGLTLLEIIVTLTVASILGTIIFMYMNTSLTRSAEPVVLVQKAYALNQIIEQMTADYNSLLDADSSTALTILRTNIQNGNDDSNSPYHGEYSESTKWLQFDNTRNELSGDNGDRILKAVITIDEETIGGIKIAEQKVTVLFTR